MVKHIKKLQSPSLSAQTEEASGISMKTILSLKARLECEDFCKTLKTDKKGRKQTNGSVLRAENWAILQTDRAAPASSSVGHSQSSSLPRAHAVGNGDCYRNWLKSLL